MRDFIRRVFKNAVRDDGRPAEVLDPNYNVKERIRQQGEYTEILDPNYNVKERIRRQKEE